MAGSPPRRPTIASRRIGRGERAPDFALPFGDGQATTRFYGQAGGRPAVVVFAGGAGEMARDLAVALVDEVSPDSCDVFVVTQDAACLDDRSFLDPNHGVHDAWGIADGDDPTVVVLDPNVRVIVVHESAGPDDVAAVVAALPDHAIAAPGGRAPRHAPVLLVPDALDQALCAQLMATWEQADPVATGVETMADGRHVEALDDLRKRRRDHVVTEPTLLRTLTAHVGRRVIPELAKAFAFSATRFEGFKLGCYTDEDAGFFQAHRDNLSPTTAHRKFALSLNLNDDYEGGELCFPEYGPALYRPDPGEALVFSGGHLHEVRPVTRGRRFVLLSFLF
ncbi:MAG TPA: 2OG-Fe(II) oxygenase [Nitriliruptoraceae bacterium]|nr:2OG-Fe(II) oxygenase [Nitriliruptoraceae bacterium]